MNKWPPRKARNALGPSVHAEQRPANTAALSARPWEKRLTSIARVNMPSACSAIGSEPYDKNYSSRSPATVGLICGCDLSQMFLRKFTRGRRNTNHVLLLGNARVLVGFLDLPLDHVLFLHDANEASHLPANAITSSAASKEICRR